MTTHLLPLGSEAKLAALRQLDGLRPWNSLEDVRHCTRCGRLFHGREIQILVRVDGPGLLLARCPTEGCGAEPDEWVCRRDELMVPGAEEEAVSEPRSFPYTPLG